MTTSAQIPTRPNSTRSRLARDPHARLTVRRTITTPALLLAQVWLCASCADAPIEAENLRPDGQLRPSAYQQAGFVAAEAPRAQRAVAVSAVLAAQPHGPLEDALSFPADVGAVHLHLRADGLERPRPVLVRWTSPADGDTASPRTEEILAVLAPGRALSLAASHRVEPEQAGTWTVEVLGLPLDGEPAPVLFSRSFQIEAPPEGPSPAPSEQPVPP